MSREQMQYEAPQRQGGLDNVMEIRPATPEEKAADAVGVPQASVDLLEGLSPEERENLAALHAEVDGAEDEEGLDIKGPGEVTEEDAALLRAEEAMTAARAAIVARREAEEAVNAPVPTVPLPEEGLERNLSLLDVHSEGKRHWFTWIERLTTENGLLAYATYVTEAEYAPAKVDGAVVRKAAGGWKHLSGPVCPFLQVEPGTYNIVTQEEE